MRLRFDFKANGWPTRALCFNAPIEVIAAYTIDEVVPAIEAVGEAASRGLWAGGFVAYEAAPAFDRAFETHADCNTPLVWFGIFEAPVTEPDEAPSPTCPQDEWRPTITRAEYDRCVNEIREAVGRGDLYQANYTFPLRCRTPYDAYAMYLDLQRSSLCGYGAYLDVGDLTVVSASPELFFQFSHHDRTITTRPMKGTRPRGRWLEEDLNAANMLAESVKDRAENLMIVDLLRNDLGRIAVNGTVRTVRLFEVERYPTVWQMTSTITASARQDVSLTDMLRALFPCGSVTGAPKIAAMHKIAQLERSARGIYCGAIGMVCPGGDALFSVAIRTVIIDPNNDEAIYRIGGGITWDSTVNDEYQEALCKASVLVETCSEFDLVETLRLECGEFHLQQRHVDRIIDSALYFERPLSVSDVESALSACVDSYPSGVWRVRLLADRFGMVRTECAPLVPVEGRQTFRLAAQHHVSIGDRFLYHKTTYRRAYERAAKGCGDVYDVLLINELGELTEFTRGNLVVEIGDAMLTPPRCCGLLAGTFRQEMLALGRITERAVTLNMLQHADRVWFINSVRGWIEIAREPIARGV